MAAGGTVSTTLSEWLLVALIIFTLVIETILHRFEHWITHHHLHLASVVRVLYRELMILGLISFIFIVYETVAKPNGTIILSFEFAHVFIFLFAIFYTLVVLSSMLTSLRLSSRWKKMERMDVVHYLNAKNQYTALRRDVVGMKNSIWRLFWWFPDMGKLVRYMRLHEIITFHDIRFQFIYYRNLPEDFRFSSFLRKIKSITFIELVESHWSHYVLFLAIVLADIIRRYVIHGPLDLSEPKEDNPSERAKSDESGDSGESSDPGKKALGEFNDLESIFIISASIILAIFSQLLSVKVRRVYWELTRHPRLYYEGVQPDTFKEEFEKLERDRSSISRSDIESGKSTTDLGDAGNEADDERPGAPGVSVRGEDELLNPMHLAPLRPPSAATSVNLNSTNNLREFFQDPSAPPSARTSVSIDRQRLGTGHVSASAPKPSPPLSQRTSLERPRPVGLPFSPPEKRAHTDLNASVLASRTEQGLPSSHVDDFDEIVVRHSLEVQRVNAIASTPAPPPKVVGASIALAALEAAKKRKAAAAAASSAFDELSPPPSFRGGSLEFDRNGRGAGLSPGFISTFSSRRGSLDEIGRASMESRGRRQGRSSIEMAVVVPRDELAARFEDDGLSANDSSDEGGEGPRGVGSRRGFNRASVRPAPSGGRGVDYENKGKNGDVIINMGDENESDAGTYVLSDSARDAVEPVNDDEHDEGRLNRSRSVNPTILKNLEHQRRAQTMSPSNKYPRFVVKLIPRLGRVASPVEKLFWFGSHQFFLWCVEFVLFFSTVLLAATCAGLSLLPLTNLPLTPLNISALVLAGLNLLFILMKTAGIMKRYIFILHNASLIPEVVAIEAIQNVRQKRLVVHDKGDSSGSDMERDEDGDAARERRLRLGRFFRTEAEEGNVPGIEGGTRGSRTSWDQSIRRRWRRRKALRRRLVRAAEEEDEAPSMNGALTNSVVRIAPESDSDYAKPSAGGLKNVNDDAMTSTTTITTNASALEKVTDLPVAEN